jgi:hypothetical protein
MDIRDLFKGASFSVESHDGKRQIWIRVGRQHFPVVVREGPEKPRPTGIHRESSTPSRPLAKKHAKR